MLSARKHKRFLITTSGALKANIHYCDLPLKLFTFGQGGCSFLGMDPAVSLVPPQSIRLTFEYGEQSVSKLRKEIDGQLIYVRPHNPTMEMMYGVKFVESQVVEMMPFVSELEDLSKRGLVDRA